MGYDILENQKALEAEVIVIDDADAFKQVADELGLNHQVCKKHVERNTEALIESLKPQVKEDKDGSLEAIKVSPEQAIADLDRLGELVRERKPEDEVNILSKVARQRRGEARWDKQCC